jgi:hypothetical protein
VRVLLLVLALSCSKPAEPPAIAPDKAAPAGVAPAPSASVAGWKRLETKLGFSLEFPEKIFTATTDATGASLTSKLAVNAPHGVEPKGASTEHRYSARIELRSEGVVDAVKRVVPYAAEVGFPKGTVASFTPTADFFFKTNAAGRDAYVVLWGAHGYAKRSYFVVVDKARTLTVEFNVITDYLAHEMPKAFAMTEQAQIDTAEAVVSSLKL